MVKARPFGVYVGRSAKPAKPAKPISRFDGSREREAPGGIPHEGIRSAGVEVAHVNVADPIEQPKAGVPTKRIRVAANIRASILDWERHRGLIDDDQHRIGRIIEDLLAIAGASGGNDSGVRLDPGTRKELAIAYGIDRARMVNQALDQMRQIVGTTDALVIRRVLGDRWSYDAVAIEIGAYQDRASRYAARRFRDALAVLARDFDP